MRAARQNAAARSGLTSDNRSKEETAWGAAVLRSARRLWGFDGVCFDLSGHFGLSAVVKLHSSRQFRNRLDKRLRRVRTSKHQYWPARQSSVLSARADKALSGCKRDRGSWWPSQSRGCAYWLYAHQRFDDAHRRTTVWTDEGGLNRFICCPGAIRFFNSRCNMQQRASPRQVLPPSTIGDQPIVADAMESTG